MNSYLTEALKGNYIMGGEDRISQIFSASFNHSKIFKKSVLKFFGLPFQNDLESETQKQYTATDRLDILISTSNAEFIVIENKVGAGLTKEQLSKYDKMPEIEGCHKYCLVYDYYTFSKISSTWKIRYWSDFFSKLEHLPKKDFITSNFLDILKKYKMDIPETIKDSDLKSLSKALYEIKFKDKVDFSFNKPIFETLVDFKKILLDIFSRAAKDEIIQKRVGKKFRPNVYFSHWWPTDDASEKDETSFWIGREVPLVKPYKNIVSFGAALCLDRTKSSSYGIVAYVTYKDKSWKEGAYWYPKKDFNRSEFYSAAQKYWCEQLK